MQIPLLRPGTHVGGEKAHSGPFIKSCDKVKEIDSVEMGDLSLNIEVIDHQLHELENMEDSEVEPLFKALAQKHHLPSVAVEKMSIKHKRSLLMSSKGCGYAKIDGFSFSTTSEEESAEWYKAINTACQSTDHLLY